MDIHASEKEQVEALKKWWKDNGTSIVSGLLIGLAVLLGGKAWFGFKETRANNASNLYAQMMNALDAGREEEARSHANEIIGGFSDTAYAPLTALALARSAMQNGELDAAQAQLQWALEHAGSDPVKHTARLRLIRLLIEKGDNAGALAQLEAVGDAGAYAYQYDELRGDLALSQGQKQQAALAYQHALERMPAGSPETMFIRLKYENLAGVLPETETQ